MAGIAGYLPPTHESVLAERRRARDQNARRNAEQAPIIAAIEATASRRLSLAAAHRELELVRVRLGQLANAAAAEPEEPEEPAWVTAALQRRASHEAILVASESDPATRERARVHIEKLDAKLADHERGGRTTATPAPDPQTGQEARLREKETALLARIADLEEQERRDNDAWNREQDAQLSQQREAALRAEFEREDAAAEERRFAVFKQRQVRRPD